MPCDFSRGMSPPTSLSPAKNMVYLPIGPISASLVLQPTSSVKKAREALGSVVIRSCHTIRPLAGRGVLIVVSPFRGLPGRVVVDFCDRGDRGAAGRRRKYVDLVRRSNHQIN